MISAVPQANQTKKTGWKVASKLLLYVFLSFVLVFFILILGTMALMWIGNDQSRLQWLMDVDKSPWLWLMRYAMYAAVWLMFPVFLRSQVVVASKTDRAECQVKPLLSEISIQAIRRLFLVIIVLGEFFIWGRLLT